jgi:hypothetical protein
MLNFHYSLIAEWLCFLSAILLLVHSDKYWQTLRFYLCFVVYNESIGYYMVAVAKYNSNNWLYNLFILVEYGYGIWLLTHLINLKSIKFISWIAYLLFYTSYFVEYVNQGDSIANFFNKADAVGSEVMIVLCMIYYYSLFQEEKYVNLLKEPLFWLVSGCFIFYTTSIGVDTFFKKLVSVTKVHSVSLRYIILKFLNPVLYVCWIRAFLCIRNKRKSIQQL